MLLLALRFSVVALLVAGFKLPPKVMLPVLAVTVTAPEMLKVAGIGLVIVSDPTVTVATLKPKPTAAPLATTTLLGRLVAPMLPLKATVPVPAVIWRLPVPKAFNVLPKVSPVVVITFRVPVVP